MREGRMRLRMRMRMREGGGNEGAKGRDRYGNGPIFGGEETDKGLLKADTA
jgi:hypothetical protein